MDHDHSIVHAEGRRPCFSHVLCPLLGYLGAHRIYLRQPRGFLQGGLTVAGIVTIGGTNAR